jgi:iron complex outermembrane receptor protein
MKKIILFSTLMCIVLSSWSQQRTRVTISGIINDAKTGAPLPGASILLVESKQGAVADSNGRYIFRNVPPAHTLIEISHEGYRSLVEHLDITTATEKNFSLTQSIIEN